MVILLLIKVLREMWDGGMESDEQRDGGKGMHDSGSEE